MKILLAGKDGQVGWELQQTLAPLGEVVACDRATLDLTNPDQIVSVVRAVKPEVIVNAAAYTAVDQAESEPELAFAVNAKAPGILAEEAKRLGALLVHYSTDYIFDGTKTSPYVEDDEPGPLSCYGRTKLAGERAILATGSANLIFRTGWVYGLRGRNFLLTMLRLGREKSEIRVVNDQVGAPTWCRMIAEATGRVLSQTAISGRGSPEKYGIYHLTAGGQTSWHGFAERIFATFSLPEQAGAPRLIPIPSSAYPLPAKRPPYSVLSNAAFAREWGSALPDWQTGLGACRARMTPGQPAFPGSPRRIV